MGLDYEAFIHNINLLTQGESNQKFEDLPSILLAKKIQEKFNCIIATEIMDPSIQMPLLDRCLKGVVMPWNPAVNQLGWPMMCISKYCEKNNWLLGIKNPKNLGISTEDSEVNNISAPMEKVWSGVASYSALPNERKVLIHRGIDCPFRGDFRAALVHKAAIRTKLANPNIKLFFDPSHSYGPKLKDKIVDGTIEALKVKDSNGNFVYDGILIETGTSQTDTYQHITIKELENMVNEIIKFREI
ncbi:MAG TPA: hypothetical protein VLL98_02515 [Rickettsiales bacterium]|nr:hypothetical protein [Rickettsiales bacterium]